MSIASFVNTFRAPSLPSYAPLASRFTTVEPHLYVTDQEVLSPLLTILEKAESGDSEDEFHTWEEFQDDAYDRSPVPLDGNNKHQGGSSEFKVKRQTENGRPVNIFGLGFGSDQRSDGEAQENNREQRPHRPVSNSDVTFGEKEFEEIIEDDAESVVNAAAAESSKLQQDSVDYHERQKRQTTNGRPVNIFGLGFGTNVSPGRGPPQQQPQVSNGDVTFDEDRLQELIEGAMNEVADSALKKTKATPEELVKKLEGMDFKNGSNKEAEKKKEDPNKTIITRYQDLIFHPDVTDVLMLMLGIIFFAVFTPGLVGFIANFVPPESLPFLQLPRPTLNG